MSTMRKKMARHIRSKFGCSEVQMKAIEAYIDKVAADNIRMDENERHLLKQHYEGYGFGVALIGFAYYLHVTSPFEYKAPGITHHIKNVVKLLREVEMEDDGEPKRIAEALEAEGIPIWKILRDCSDWVQKTMMTGKTEETA